MADKDADMTKMVHNPTHGIMPVHVDRLIRTRSVSLEAYRRMTAAMGPDWQGIRNMILDGIPKDGHLFDNEEFLKWTE